MYRWHKKVKFKTEISTPTLQWSETKCRTEYTVSSKYTPIFQEYHRKLGQTGQTVKSVR